MNETSVPASHTPPLIDPFLRPITYLRASVTDRCDFRCTYCMAEDMEFLPKRQVLALEELERLCSAFIRLGVRKLRLTGGEPLVRKNVMQLFRTLGRHISSGALDELTLTTNGSQLARFADELAECGVRRVNVSLDTLDAATFQRLTRWGKLEQVLSGLEAADKAGLKVKINAVALKGLTEGEASKMVAWCGERGYDLTFIEVMPLGDIGSQSRFDQYLPLSDLRRMLEADWRLEDIPYRTGGPARYTSCVETGQKVGFITPLTHNFCEGCNRVRLTCTGTLFMCLGQADRAEFRDLMRAHPGAHPGDEAVLEAAIREAIARKPKGHDFVIDRERQTPALPRHMSMTGG